MAWELCIQYSNGKFRTLHIYRNRESALRKVDAIYSEGYPMHVAYIVRLAQTENPIAPQSRLAG